MSYQVDRALDDLRGAMRQLHAATRGMPVKQTKLRSSYTELAKTVAALVVQVDDARSVFTNPG
jgi:hypothetical protein